jgi:hypothetical protein
MAMKEREYLIFWSNDAKDNVPFHIYFIFLTKRENALQFHFEFLADVLDNHKILHILTIAAAYQRDQGAVYFPCVQFHQQLTKIRT